MPPPWTDLMKNTSNCCPHWQFFLYEATKHASELQVETSLLPDDLPRNISQINYTTSTPNCHKISQCAIAFIRSLILVDDDIYMGYMDKWWLLTAKRLKLFYRVPLHTTILFIIITAIFHCLTPFPLGPLSTACSQSICISQSRVNWKWKVYHISSFLLYNQIFRNCIVISNTGQYLAKKSFTFVRM